MKRILCIEDDAETRILFKKSLEAEGYLVDTVWDGQRGIEAVRSGDFACVLLDIIMPGLDGFAVLAALKEGEQSQNVPVLMVSARSDDKTRERARQAGADAYLVKPFQVQHLAEVVGNLIAGQPVTW